MDTNEETELLELLAKLGEPEPKWWDYDISKILSDKALICSLVSYFENKTGDDNRGQL